MPQSIFKLIFKVKEVFGFIDSFLFFIHWLIKGSLGLAWDN